jgi:hypothetical protein
MKTLADFRPVLDAIAENRAVLNLTSLELKVVGDVLVITAWRGHLVKQRGYTHIYLNSVKDMDKVLDALTFSDASPV